MVNGKVQKNAKVRPPTRTIVKRNAAPRKRTQPYSRDTRLAAILRYANGAEDATVQQLRQLSQYPVRRTIRRYRRKITREGTYYEYRHNGNIRAYVLRGADQVLLSLYVQCFPHATGLEKIAFLYRATGTWYNESQITKAEQRIGLSRKKASTDASQAFEPRYLLQRQHFWHSPYPWGIADIDCEDMIDLDECKVLIEHANRKFAKCILGRRCRKTGLYGHGKGRILLMAIRPDGQRWYKFVDQPGTDVTLFAPFINEILADLGQWAPGRPRYCFTMDNLNVHHHPNVINAILTAGYRVVFRVPYRPIDGPIELLFNVYEGELRKRLFKIKNMADLVRETQNIIRSFGPFRPYFHKVGFR